MPAEDPACPEWTPNRQTYTYGVEMKTHNLNHLAPVIDGQYDPEFLDREAKRSEPTAATGDVLVFFDHIEQHLLREIEMADAVIGCVAWLTHFDIIAAMAKKRGASIIVQKEDFLRPDTDGGSRNGWKENLRRAYTSIKCVSRLEFQHVSSLSYCSDDTLHAVRCMGNHNSDRAPAFPRMHHKFVLFCSYAESKEENNECGRFTPYAVWTGSFNFTKNATQSLENAILLRAPKIVQAYYNEWARCVALSEPLNWESDWCDPEWRIGS